MGILNRMRLCVESSPYLARHHIDWPDIETLRYQLLKFLESKSIPESRLLLTRTADGAYYWISFRPSRRNKFFSTVKPSRIMEVVVINIYLSHIAQLCFEAKTLDDIRVLDPRAFIEYTQKLRLYGRWRHNREGDLANIIEEAQEVHLAPGDFQNRCAVLQWRASLAVSQKKKKDESARRSFSMADSCRRLSTDLPPSYESGPPAYCDIEPDQELLPNYESGLPVHYDMDKDQGKRQEAETIYLQALEGYEKAWGPDYTSTLDTVNSLGNVYAIQGKLQEAETIYLQALEGYEKAWGPDHTSTLGTVNNLGNVYAIQGKLQEAEIMYLRAFEGKEKSWGPDHTSTLNTVNNLGLLYKDQGKLQEAETMYLWALEGYEKAIGIQYIAKYRPAINTRINLGDLKKSQTNLIYAKEHYQHAYNGLKELLGPLHKDTQRIQTTLLDLNREIESHSILTVRDDTATAIPERSKKSRRGVLRRVFSIGSKFKTRNDS